MLNILRRGVKTWVAKVLFTLLVASFAIWGIQDVFSSSQSSTVAKVGDTKITAEQFANALNRDVRAASNRIGVQLEADMIRSLGLPGQALSRLVQEAAMDETIASLGVSAPDEAVREVILADPSFTTQGGGFDDAQYRYVLAQNGYNLESYEDQIRRAIVRRQLILAFSEAAAPSGAIDAIYRHETEQRSFDLIVLDAEMADDPGQPGDTALAQWHEDHPEVFTEPERRSAIYLHLSEDALTANWEPEEGAIETLYERVKASFSQPEQREIFQIIYTDEAEAAAAADALSSGAKSFDDLLADRGESRADAALGLVGADDLAEAISEAAFALPAPGAAGPVPTGFGFAVIDVTEIEPARSLSLEEMRPDLLAELKRERAYEMAPEIAGEVEERRAAGATLAEIAEALNIPLGEADGVSRSGDGGDDFTGGEAFLTELFEALEDEERDMAETEEGEYFVLRVTKITPEQIIPLADARETAAEGWRDEKIQDLLAAKAEEMTSRINAGETLADVAEAAGLATAEAGPGTRGQEWPTLPDGLAEQLFALDQGGAAFMVDEESAVVGVVKTIAEGEDNERNQALRDALTRQMNEMAANDALALYINSRQQKLGVSVNQQAIDALMT